MRGSGGHRPPPSTAFGGLRIGELAGLQLGDFDPLRSLIRVRRTASDVQGRVIIGPPKTAKSNRTVGLPRSITDRLVDHVAQLNEKGLEVWLFPAPEGGPIRRTGWTRRVWKPALAAAGLDQNLGTHTLRRSRWRSSSPRESIPRSSPTGPRPRLGTDRPRRLRPPLRRR
jgi:integrase